VTDRRTALQRLLDLRGTELRVAEIALTGANTALARTREQCAGAEREREEWRAEITTFAADGAERRRRGFTIAQRLLDAETEKSLRARLDDAELSTKRHRNRLREAARTAEERHAEYTQARNQEQLVGRRVEAQRAQRTARTQRTENEEIIDAFVSKRFADNMRDK
jgi:hypothetical protein